MELRYTGEKPEKEVFEIFHDTMKDLIESDERVVYLDADLMGSLKTQDLWKTGSKSYRNGLRSLS